MVSPVAFSYSERMTESELFQPGSVMTIIRLQGAGGYSPVPFHYTTKKLGCQAESKTTSNNEYQQFSGCIHGYRRSKKKVGA